MIAALELYGILLGIMTLLTDDVLGTKGARFGSVRIGAYTDNESNQFLLQKYITTKFPLCCVLMEIAAQCELRSLDPNASWIPRDQNQPADDLTNEVYNKFDPARRIVVKIEELPFLVLPGLLAAGEEFVANQEQLKNKRKATEQTAASKKVAKEKVPLRLRDPW